MTKAIFTYLSCFEPGFFWQIRAQTAAEDVCTWVQLAHTRFGGPQVNMMATAELVESETHGPMLRENCFDVGYCYKMCVSIVGAMFKHVGRDHPVEAAYIAAAPRCLATVETAGDQCHLNKAWESMLPDLEVQIFPPVQVQKARPASNIRDDLMRGLKALDQRRATPRKREGVLKTVGPKVAMAADGDAASDDGPSEYCGSSAFEDPSSSDGGDGDDPPPPPPLLAPDAADADPRQTRLHPFGPWTISGVWDTKRNVQIGWGANCGGHFCTAGKACKKQIGAAAAGSLSNAQALAKEWLLRGRAIPAGRPNGRDDHVLGIQRADLEIRPHHELDLEASSLL